MRDDFGIFILTHGRPELCGITIRAMLDAGYSGKWWLVLDTDDTTRAEYESRWGADRILIFDKDEAARHFDLADNHRGPRGVIIYARNAVEQLAREQGLSYYQQLDDDYTRFAHRVRDGASLRSVTTRRLDDVIDAFIGFLDASGALTVAFAQSGDLLGGIAGDFRKARVKRKAMNTFISRVGRPIRFVGRINEDVNTYVWRGSQGELFFTVTDFAIVQMQTQSQSGGMTSTYLDGGTYVKSFYTVMHHPSSVKIGTTGWTVQRIHHRIKWRNTTPKILSPAHRRVRQGE